MDKYYTLNQDGQKALALAIRDAHLWPESLKPEAYFEDAEEEFNRNFGYGNTGIELGYTESKTRVPVTIDLEPEWFDSVPYY